MTAPRMNSGNIHVWAPQFCGFGGGIAAFGAALAESLHGGHNHICLFGKLDTTFVWKGMRLTGAGYWPKTIRTVGFALKVIIGVWRDKPSLIISTHLNFGPIAKAVRELFGVPYVLVAHGIDVHPGLSPSRIAALCSANAVWAVSRWTRSRLLDIGVAADRIQILPNTVSEERFTVAPPDPALRKRYGIEPDEKVILTVARLDAREGYKGYDRILRALPQVRNAVPKLRYLIVGKGTDSIRIQMLAAELGIADCLTLCGFIPDTELADHYRLANVFAMPSEGEGFGIVFLEAMACGIPVLAGNLDGSADALADGKLGQLVDPRGITAIADGLIALLSGKGQADWFKPEILRAQCIKLYGQAAFRDRALQLIAVLSGLAK